VSDPSESKELQSEQPAEVKQPPAKKARKSSSKPAASSTRKRKQQVDEEADFAAAPATKRRKKAEPNGAERSAEGKEQKRASAESKQQQHRRSERSTARSTVTYDDGDDEIMVWELMEQEQDARDASASRAQSILARRGSGLEEEYLTQSAFAVLCLVSEHLTLVQVARTAT